MEVPELLRPQYLNDPASYSNTRKRLQKVVGEMMHMIEIMVCGYHVYTEIQCAAIGEELPCKWDDPFAVAVVRLGVIAVTSQERYR